LESVLETIGDAQRDGAPARAALLEACRAALKQGRALAEEELLATRRGTRCAQALSATQDEVIRAVHGWATRFVYPRENPSEAEQLAIAAVGGYGRGTLAP